jgi:hypothetical protein
VLVKVVIGAVLQFDSVAFGIRRPERQMLRSTRKKGKNQNDASKGMSHFCPNWQLPSGFFYAAPGSLRGVDIVCASVPKG